MYIPDKYLKMSGVMATARIVIKRMAPPLCGRRTPPCHARTVQQNSRLIPTLDASPGT